jgi:uncharacterized membrane protein YeaQ/YmgE (transglycosylase-associated protein family)
MLLLAYVVIGLLAGLLAHLVMKGSALGLLCDVASGCVGGTVGGLLMSLFGPTGQSPFLSLAAAAVGGCIVIMIAGPLKSRL